MPAGQAFPLGATLSGGAYVVTDRIAGERARGRFRGLALMGITPRNVLITVTSAQVRPLPEVEAALAFPVEGVAALLHVGALAPASVSGTTYDGLVEEEPEGTPMSERTGPIPVDAARALVLQVGDVLARVHQAGGALGALEPELVYARPTPGGGLALTALAPRSVAFAAGARRPDYIVGPMFRASHEAPEKSLGEPARPAADVFSLCALAARWVSGAFPAPRPWTGPGAWEEALAGGLEREPARRWSLARVLEHLRR